MARIFQTEHFGTNIPDHGLDQNIRSMKSSPISTDQYEPAPEFQKVRGVRGREVRVRGSMIDIDPYIISYKMSGQNFRQNVR